MESKLPIKYHEGCQAGIPPVNTTFTLSLKDVDVKTARLAKQEYDELCAMIVEKLSYITDRLPLDVVFTVRTRQQ